MKTTLLAVALFSVTAAAVAFEGGAGALYLDSLLPHKKVFLSTDIKLLQTIGAALGPRLRG